MEKHKKPECFEKKKMEEQECDGISYATITAITFAIAFQVL